MNPLPKVLGKEGIDHPVPSHERFALERGRDDHDLDMSSAVVSGMPSMFVAIVADLDMGCPKR